MAGAAARDRWLAFAVNDSAVPSVPASRSTDGSRRQVDGLARHRQDRAINKLLSRARFSATGPLAVYPHGTNC